MPIIETIIAQHAEEAAFLWLLRDAACDQPHYNLKDLADLDERVEAHLDGLRIAGEEGRAVCDEVWGMDEAGEVFAAVLLAFESEDQERIDAVLEIAAAGPELIRGAVSALGWLSKPVAKELLPRLLVAENPAVRQIGIGGYAVRRMDPGPALDAALADDHPGLRARALRAVGELGRVDLLPCLQGDVMAPDEGCRFSAAWSAALFGDLTAVAVLKSFAGSERYWERATSLAFRRMPTAVAQVWRDQLEATPAFARLGFQGAGALGDPAAVPWLLERMAIPGLARPAGEAFAMITGADLAYEDLDGERPEGFAAGPTEDAVDENVAMDPDEDLPWPDPTQVERWWVANGQRFVRGNRYLAGQPLAVAGLDGVLRTGTQRQRAAAALERAALLPGTPVFAVRERGDRQQRRLAAG